MPVTFPRTVAQLLLGHAEARSTGVLTLSRGQVRKQLFLREGVLVSAESNLREEALGEVLVALELLPRQRLNPLLEEIKRRGQKMGTVVIELGWVSPDDVMAALREQVRRRAEGCLRSPEGEAQFEARSDFVGNLIEHRFELPPLVFTGLRETSTLEMLAPLLDASDAQEVRLGPRFGRFRAEFDASFGGQLSTLLQPGCDLGTLVMRPDASELVYALEALLLSGLATVTPASAGAAVDRHLSGTESSKLPLPDSWQADTQPELRAEFPRDPSTGGGSFGDPGPQGAPTTDPALPRDVMREFLEVHGRHAHDVLGVREGASKAEIDRALAAKRARLLGLGAVGPHQGLVDELLEAYTRAHAALDNPTRPDIRRPTATYSAIPAVAPGMDPLGAELAFGEAHALLTRGRQSEAIAQFRKAVDKRPDQAAYHAFLGWTLFQVHARQAMPEALDRLEHAVAVDPDSAEAHALLGEVLAALSDPGRARGHLERALVLRPEQPQSIELLARLYVEASEPELAEKLYRRVLGALGERDLPLRRTLWRELAELYEGPLMDTTAAARAYAVAAHLDPSDPSLPKKAAAALTAGIARGDGLE